MLGLSNNPVLISAERQLLASLPDEKYKFDLVLVDGLRLMYEAETHSIASDRLKAQGDELVIAADVIASVVETLRQDVANTLPLASTRSLATMLLFDLLDFTEKIGRGVLTQAALNKAVSLTQERISQIFGIPLDKTGSFVESQGHSIN